MQIYCIYNNGFIYCTTYIDMLLQVNCNFDKAIDSLRPMTQ